MTRWVLGGDVAEDKITRKLTTILAADVEGYTRLMRADEEATLKTLGEYRDVVDGLIARHEGRVFSTGGDSVLAEFGSAVEAVRCAISCQEEISSHNAELADDRKLMFRIGINVGDVMIRDGDLFGDGVNVAARLEGLAEAGGVCISGSVFEQIKHKLSLGFEDMGPQEVKNIAEPVSVYRLVPGQVSVSTDATAAMKPADGKRWRMPAIAVVAAALVALVGGVLWWQPWAPEFEPASVERMAFPLPDKPSIAVLPFDNLSDDPEQGYFADGMTEDIITDLSKLSGLFVIARNSSFQYKDRSVDVKTVGRELGVKYVLEGSVRRVGDQVRINAQLIDARSGGHLWAERYDGTMADVFALQDRVTNKLVSALAIALDQGEKVVRAIQDTDNPRAYDAFLQGRAHYRRWNIDAFGRAVPFFKQALALDPDYAQAHAALAAIYWQSWRRWGERGKPWPPGMGVKVENYYQALDLAKAHLEKAMRRPTPLAHQVAARMHLTRRRYEAAITEAERAAALDPGDANAQATLAYVLVFGGQAEEAAAVIARAMRLDPHYPPNYLGISGIVTFALGDLAGAAELLGRRYQRNPEDQVLVPMQVSALMQIGREAEARRLFDDYEGMKHTITPRYPYWPFKDLDVFERFAQGWIAAGACCRRELEDLMKELRAKTQAQQ
jgi:TolB-like protein/class 3 adenylate cyclase/Flp pilus assembly protein TadD